VCQVSTLTHFSIAMRNSREIMPAPKLTNQYEDPRVRLPLIPSETFHREFPRWAKRDGHDARHSIYPAQRDLPAA